MGYHPVFLGQTPVERYYEGFANRTIWPLFPLFLSNAGYSSEEVADARSILEKLACAKPAELNTANAESSPPQMTSIREGRG